MHLIDHQWDLGTETALRGQAAPAAVCNPAGSWRSAQLLGKGSGRQTAWLEVSASTAESG